MTNLSDLLLTVFYRCVFQSKLGSLFRPMLPLTHIQEVEPPICSPKLPLSPQPEPEAKPELLPTTSLTSVNRDSL